jgi:pantothenate synthetase
MVRDHAGRGGLVLPIVRDRTASPLQPQREPLPARSGGRRRHRALQAAEEAIASGERDPEKVADRVRELLEGETLLRVDYVALVDTGKLQPVPVIEGEVLLAVAVWAGRIRLIDNTVIRV